ncbi:MAG: hypothetical protein KAS07_03040, partial [Candidatus Pacebacteria bacterium]|nr:hypothetical protein [Candidatus Paceibacterota bacterium]
MEFVWGVLALNIDRTIYTPESEAYIQMGVLDDTGHTICDADIALTITNASGEALYYSTQKGTVQKSGECSGDSYVEMPDYFAYYTVPEDLGEYHMHFSATRDGETHFIEDTFEVRENVTFDVERSGPTRIYPPEKYAVNFSIVTEEDFSGVVEESVPKSFETYKQAGVRGYDSARMEGDTKILFWNVDIKAGEKIDIGYLFDAPDISPAFYLMGPLTFKNIESGEIEFEELRKWQIAGDATAGDFAIYREILGTDVITTANFDHNWDNTVVESSSSFNLNADNTQIELQSGHYAVMYGARFDTTGSNKRSEFQTQLRLNGSDLPIGWSQGFMNRTSGANEAFTAGGGIIEVATNDDPLVLRTFRTDANSAGAARAANVSSITLLALDDTWDYIRLSRTNTQTGPTSATWVDVQYNRQDEYDTSSFTHSTTTNSNNITLKTVGHYLVFANTYGAITTADKTLVRQRLTLGGTQIDGTLTTVLNHGNVNGNSTMEGAASL